MCSTVTWFAGVSVKCHLQGLDICPREEERSGEQEEKLRWAGEAGRGPEDGSVGKRACCSSWGPELESPAPHRKLSMTS